MSFYKMLALAVVSPQKLMNLPNHKGKAGISFLLVILTCIASAVYPGSADLSGVLLWLGTGLASFLAFCASFYIVSLIFNKHVDFKTIISGWGISYVPTLACVLALWILLLFPPYLSPLAGFVVNTFFIMVLVWKTIIYFLFMKQILNVTFFELSIGTVFMAFSLFVLMTLCFRVGLQIPVL